MISYKELKSRIENGEVKWDCSHDTMIKDSFESNHFFRELELKMFFDYDESKERQLFWGECRTCGEFIHYYFKDNTFVAKEKSCFEVAPYYVDISLPSGTLILADWIKHGKELFSHLETGNRPLASEKGLQDRSKSFGEGNVMHFYVGNTCPTVNLHSNGFSVGRNGYDDVPYDDGEDVGMICTDLWWVTGIDKKHYEALAIEKFGEEVGLQMTTEAIESADVLLDLEPGIYRCHYHLFKDDTPELLVRAEKISLI